ncbi:B12-binding domain-containing radical SAM protein [bacterium AH-315-F18]|nr:B12-binding domain-containing radical SAM protein [bacterium AH-315-F18]
MSKPNVTTDSEHDCDSRADLDFPVTKREHAPDLRKVDQDILTRLKGETLSGKMAFLNPNSRSRRLVRTGPPVGLMLLMGIFRDLGFPYGYIEGDAFDMSDDEVISAIKAGGYKYLGLPLVSLRAQFIFPSLERIKRETGVILIVGGPLPTNDCEWMMESCPAIDYAIRGEAEVLLPCLLLALEDKYPIEDVPGLTYRNGNELVSQDMYTGFIHGSQLPLPDFDQFDFRNYPGASPVGAWPSVNLYANRGCPFKCTFCGNSIWLHKPNAVDVSMVMRWLEILVKKGAKEAYFADDILNVNKRWTDELFHTIIKEGYNEKLRFRGLFRADLTTEDQLIQAKKAGFWVLTLGAESGSQEILDFYYKQGKVEATGRAVEWARKAGMKTLCSFIAGAPIDTAETLLTTANFIREIDPTYAPINILHPFMGAPVTTEIIKRGLLTAEEIRAYDHTGHIIRTETLDTKELEDIVDWIRQDFLSFKQSKIFRVKRLSELAASGRIADPVKAEAEVDYEVLEAQYAEQHVIVKSVLIDHSGSGLKWLNDHVLMDTPDIRLDHEGWHLQEKGMHWSRPKFVIPFYLGEERDLIELVCNPMREGASITVSIQRSGEDAKQANKQGPKPMVIDLDQPGWAEYRLPLPEAILGEAWLTVEFDQAFTAPGDPRELGGAFRKISFLNRDDLPARPQLRQDAAAAAPAPQEAASAS